MMKHVFISIGFVLLLLSFSSCTDDNLSNGGQGGQPEKENFDFTVRIPHGTSSYVLVIGSMTGDVQSITSDADWISAVQDGQDGEQHPVLQLTLTGTDKNERTANVTLKSLSNQQVTITVKQRGVSLMGDGEIIPEVTVMNEAFYKDWFKGDNGKVYITESSDRDTWMYRNLPWGENSLGSVPADVADEITKHMDDWKLVYSTLGLESTSGANFFTLFNSKLSKLRFFYYIPANSITSGSSAVFAVDVYNPQRKMSHALNSNAMLEVPDDLQNSGKLNSETTKTYYVMPIGTGSDRTITSGWACFDLDADHGYSDATKEAFEDPATKLTIRLETTLSANVNLAVDLKTTGSIDMSGVTLFKEGDDWGAAATFFNGLGNAAYQVGSGIASAGQGEQGKVGGIFQAAGGVSTFVGTILSTVDVALDSSQNFEGSAKVNFDTKGSLTGTIEFNTINGLPGITFSPVAFKYNWNTLMSDNPTKWATDNTQPTFGLMNTLSSPVVYVSADHLLYTPAEMTPIYEMKSGNELISCESGDDEEFRYISFLDPSSVEMFFNKEMMGYDFEHAEISVSLTANAGPHDQYIAPTPYFGYYQLQNDQIQLTEHDTADDNVFGYGDTKSMKFVACPNSEIPTVVKGDDADFAATYNVDYKMSELPCIDKFEEVSASGFTYRYYGLTADFFNGNRKVIVDPIIYVPTNKDHLIYNKSHLGPIYVTVVARLTKSDNSMQIISKHYLPNIRAFKSSEISDIKSRISGYNPTTVKTCKGKASADYIDNGWLKARALKMLELAGK
jgi:hypothetical protein